MTTMLSACPLAMILACALGLGCSSSNPSSSTGAPTLPPPKGIQPFIAPPKDPGPGALLLTGSGEELALSGFAFPPSDMDATFMVDGWEFVLDRYITVFDDVTLWDNPNMVPADQSQHGVAVAELDGPWVIDMHLGGPVAGKGGGNEQSVAFAAITAKSDGSAFDPTVTYGFGFSTIPAPPDVYNVNLDADDLTAYQSMIANGYSVLYEGTATFKGDSAMCMQVGQVPGAMPYPYDSLPKTMKFSLGFKTPTSYINCQNGTDLSGPGVNGEDHPRGIQFKSDASVTGQVTIHMDHPFWESFAEDSPLHWDQIAAQYVGVTTPTAHLDDLKGVDFTAFTDKIGTPLPWRTCSTFYTPPGIGQMSFDPLKVTVDLKGTDPTKALRDYYDYISYTQSTQGHLNSQGLCFVSRNYPSPGGGS